MASEVSGRSRMAGDAGAGANVLLRGASVGSARSGDIGGFRDRVFAHCCRYRLTVWLEAPRVWLSCLGEYPVCTGDSGVVVSAVSLV